MFGPGLGRDCRVALCKYRGQSSGLILTTSNPAEAVSPITFNYLLDLLIYNTRHLSNISHRMTVFVEFYDESISFRYKHPVHVSGISDIVRKF